MDVFHICYCFISVCAAFVVKGIVGFGDPLVSTPMLSVFLPNSMITPGLAPVSPILNASMVWRNRAHFSGRIVLPISSFVILGTIPGIWFLKFGSPAFLKVILGLLIVGLGVEMLTRKPASNLRPNAVIRSIICFCSGFTAGLFGINLLFLAYMERISASREAFRANVCFVFFLENIFRVALYWYQGMYTADSIFLTVIAFPAAILGMKIGAALDKKIDDHLAHRFIIYVFILGGISTIVCAILQYV